MIKVRPIRSNDELKQLIEIAAADNHVVIGPTHLLIKGDEIVGYMSLGGITHVHNWFHSEKGNAKDSLLAISQGEAILAQQGITNYIVACDEESPFFGKMEKIGFTPLFNTNLYSKEV
jgi:hypothetical protein